MRYQQIADVLASLVELKDFPDIIQIFDRLDPGPRPDWDLPIIACEAAGGTKEQGLVGSTAIACLQVSIILIDDMLDDDPRGEFRDRGVGQTANLAAAFQSAAFRVISTSSHSELTKSSVLASLSHAALATSSGQHLDASNLDGEESYWRVIRAKSTPFYGSALEVGAILGGATADLAAEFYQIGVAIGEIIQIEDDLNDAFEVPANPDWIQGRNNLLILYASTADYKDRDRFHGLVPMVSDASRLIEAQKLLVSSGALSYVAFNLLSRYKLAKDIISKSELPNPRPLNRILDDYALSLRELLRKSGISIPDTLVS